MKKRDVITLLILGSIFVFIFVIVLIIENNSKDKNIKSEYEELTLLTDEQIFISVSNNINNISVYSNNEANVLNLIVKDDINNAKYKNTTFQAKEIYVISDLELYKYYVKGSFYTDFYNQNSEFIRDEYFILNYDMNSSSYNIETISKERYSEIKNEKPIFEKIERNNYNEFKYTTLSAKSRANIYFYDFYKKMINNPEEAYNLLTTETKNEYFQTLDKFKNFISKNDSFSMKQFSVDKDRIGIKDNNNNEYVFEISYILRYNVTIYKAEA